MNKEFIPYEQALELKQLGFDEPCFGCYDEKRVVGLTVMSIKKYYTNSKEDTWNCSAPLYQQAFRWFREEYGYYYEIFVDDDKTFGFMISYFIEIGRADKPIQRMYTTYEEAELECLRKLIQLVKNE